MSWIVEQSENTSAVNVHGDTITCSSDGYCGSPINVKYNDPASGNGGYFWELDFQDLQEAGGASVGLTTDQGFKEGWGLRAMKYLGNLSDGSGLLVSSFGDQIDKNDKVGLLLQLTDSDLKFYIFHNGRPLGLAFHVQSPYPKPLYPVVSFNANGKVKINRIREIPTQLDRRPVHFEGIEGNWKIISSPRHPECNGYQFEITNEGSNSYSLHAHVVNSLNCRLQFNPGNNQWRTSPIMATLMAGPPEEMHKEHLISNLISSINRVEAREQQNLVIQTNNGEQIDLERAAKPPPSPVTHNIFD